jgi:hypothetical protein
LLVAAGGAAAGAEQAAISPATPALARLRN